MIVYEWDVEECDKYGDVVDHYHENKLASLKGTSSEIEGGFWFRLVLVRDECEDDQGYVNVLDRTWAYVTKDGQLPTHTDGGERVPQKYHKEFEKNREWASKLGDRFDWQANLDAKKRS